MPFDTSTTGGVTVLRGNSAYSAPEYLSLFPNGPTGYGNGDGNPDQQATAALRAKGLPTNYAVTKNGVLLQQQTNGEYATVAPPGHGHSIVAPIANYAHGLEDDANTLTSHVVVPSMIALATAGIGSGLAGAGAVGAEGGSAGATAAATGGAADGGVAAAGGAGAAGAGAGGGGAVAASGGALTTAQLISRVLGIASPVLGGAAKSEQDQNNSRDKLLASLVGTQLSRDKFAVEAPGARMRSALQAALAKNYTPASVQWGGPGSGLKGQIPQYSGGVHSLEPALQDPSVKAMMDMVGPDMAAQERRGGASGGNQDANLGLPSSFGSESTLDRILGGGALTSSALAQILPLLTGNRQQNTGTLGQTFPNGIPYDDQTQDPTDIWGGQVPE